MTITVEVEARRTCTGVPEYRRGEPTYVVTAAHRSRCGSLSPCGSASCVRRSQVAQAVAELLRDAEEMMALRSAPSPSCQIELDRAA